MTAVRALAAVSLLLAPDHQAVVALTSTPEAHNFTFVEEVPGGDLHAGIAFGLGGMRSIPETFCFASVTLVQVAPDGGP